jgi:amino acid transporter
MTYGDLPTNGEPPSPEKPTLPSRIKRVLFGRPKDLFDRSIFHRLALIPFLAWIGLGADGLSSSSYGPQESLRSLGSHTYLCLALAAMTAITVWMISSAYSRMIEDFPHGGGGYVVASRLLGNRVGVISGCALLVDYILTITVSIAAAADALFSFVPLEWHVLKLPAVIAAVFALTAMNIRGVKESVIALMPVFLIFLATHLVLILGGIIAQVPQIPTIMHQAQTGFQSGIATLGAAGVMFLFLHAYSLGGGTYTGIEAVSNSVPILHQPRVQTAKRTMVYMAASLSFTAGGLMLCYLLWGVGFEEGKTINAVLTARMVQGIPFGTVFLLLTILSEGALLVVGAQAGFIDGPRVLANMAHDSWMPRKFSALSDRLTISNGVLLMGVSATILLLITRGDVSKLVVMYSINVFLTFSLSMFGMTRSSLHARQQQRRWLGRFVLFVATFMLCATILVVTVTEKFREGGWLTVTVTGCLVALCFQIHRHYHKVGEKLQELFVMLRDVPISRLEGYEGAQFDPHLPTAAVLVPGYSGLGIHTVLHIFAKFPGHFRNLVFLSVGVADAEVFKEPTALAEIRSRTEENLSKYLELAKKLGVPAQIRYAIGTDLIDEAEKLCLDIVREMPQTTFFAGKVLFEREHWYHRLLHNETAYTIQKRMQWAGKTMVILPARLQ